ncbi:Uncharacterised protein [Legionella spiritensis]|nr:Uncharacterised protein [Legionella spiritensis]
MFYPLQGWQTSSTAYVPRLVHGIQECVVLNFEPLVPANKSRDVDGGMDCKHSVGHWHETAWRGYVLRLQMLSAHVMPLDRRLLLFCHHSGY